MDNLKPCPFCGKRVAVLDTCKGVEECSHFEDCGDTGYRTIVCDVNKGGCGASSGYYKSEAEAAEAWNRRDNNG